MKTKQIAITLERIATMDSGKEISCRYLVTKLKNVAVLDLGSDGPNKLRYIRVGDNLNEKQADELARWKSFDVTVNHYSQ